MPNGECRSDEEKKKTRKSKIRGKLMMAVNGHKNVTMLKFIFCKRKNFSYKHTRKSIKWLIDEMTSSSSSLMMIRGKKLLIIFKRVSGAAFTSVSSYSYSIKCWKKKKRKGKFLSSPRENRNENVLLLSRLLAGYQLGMNRYCFFFLKWQRWTLVLLGHQKAKGKPRNK